MTERDSTFERLSSRQRDYLRLVFHHYNSHEIAHRVGASPRAVDKQLLLAKNLIGATSRFEAARLFAEHEAGVETLYPANNDPTQSPLRSLPLPLPSEARPTSSLTWQQVLAWGVIVALATPVAVTLGVMLIIALALLLGAHKW